MFEVERAKVRAKTTRGDESVEVADKLVFQWVGEADVDALSFQNHLPFDVDNSKDDRDAEKTESCVEGVDRGEHGQDFFNVKPPEDVDEKEYPNNG